MKLFNLVKAFGGASHTQRPRVKISMDIAYPKAGETIVLSQGAGSPLQIHYYPLQAEEAENIVLLPRNW